MIIIYKYFVGRMAEWKDVVGNGWDWNGKVEGGGGLNTNAVGGRQLLHKSSRFVE